MKSEFKLFKVPIGDWSKDGHNQCVDYYVECNYSASDMRQAYKDTCKKIGLQLNINKDYTNIDGISSWGSWRYLLTEYEDNVVSEEAIKILLEHGFSFDDINCGIYEDYDDVESDGSPKLVISEAYFDSKNVLSLFMWFISYSLPSDFKFNVVKFDAEPIIGYWNNELNHQIGYGVF